MEHSPPHQHWAKCWRNSADQEALQTDKLKVAFGKVATFNQGTEHRSWGAMLQLYRTLARLHLEYCVQIQKERCH